MNSPADARVLLFDLDDTLLDFSSNVGLAWFEALAPLASDCAADPDLLIGTIRAKAAWYWSCPERHRHGRQRLRETGAEIVGLALSELEVEHAEDFPLKVCVQGWH